MRSILALAFLAFLFSAPARAELVQAELSGHVTSIPYSIQDVRTYFPSLNLNYPGIPTISVGQPVQALLRYDTSFPANGEPQSTAGGYGLSLMLNGKQIGSTEGGVTASSGYVATPAYGLSYFWITNGLAANLWHGRPSAISLDLNDPQNKLISPAAAAQLSPYGGGYVGGFPLPGSAMLASYSPQGNASLDLALILGEEGILLDVNIAVDSIALQQAPEPSALLLFGVGGLSLLGLAPRRRAARLLR